MRLKLIFAAALFLLLNGVLAQDAEGSGSGIPTKVLVLSINIQMSVQGEAAVEEGSGAEAAAEGSGAEGSGAEGSGAEGSGADECEEGSGDDIESLLTPSKCKKGGDLSGADALAAALGGGSCDTSGMDETVRLRDFYPIFPMKLNRNF